MLSWMLIRVVNQRSFGWTMQMLVDGVVIFEAVALAVIAACLAGTVSAWRLANRVSLRLVQFE